MTGTDALAGLLGPGGEMGRRVRAHDWRQTSVGASKDWPQSLKTVVATLLECRLPMYLAWGPHYVQFYNDACKPILGAKDPDALGNSAPITWHETWATLGPLWQEVLAGRSNGFDDIQPATERLGSPEGCWNSSCSPVRDESGRVAGILVTFAETTSTKERDSLVASERAARLEAECASRLKDEFLATLSHELRTPLSAITGWVHIFRQKLGAAQTDLRKGVEVIDRSAKAQVQLIDDLLDMGRITSGKLSLDMQAVEAAAFVRSAVEQIRPSADAAGVRLLVDLDAAGTVFGDHRRLQQIVWNLLANSVKFAARGSEVRVELRETAGFVQIAVSDPGAGIKADFLPHLFERFSQADGSTTRKFGGLGLGLSIVRHLAELHGGSVSAESDGEGLGARFKVLLPLHDTAQTGQLSTPSPPPHWRAEHFDGRTILVVDDDPDARDLLKRILEDAGAQVYLACDAASALAALDRQPFDLLLSDISMPGTDGYELLRRIRSRGGAAGRMPAIALTAFARPEDRARTLDAGFADHVTKPMDPAGILAAIAAVLVWIKAAAGPPLPEHGAKARQGLV